jgi:hypothetical protein
MDYKSCIFVAMAIWLECFLQHHPEATFMMTRQKPLQGSWWIASEFSVIVWELEERLRE